MSRSLVSPLFKSTLVFYFVRSPAFAPVFLSAFIIPAAPPASYGLLFCSFFRSAPQCFLHLGPLILSSSSKHNTHISAFILREKKKKRSNFSKQKSSPSSCAFIDRNEAGKCKCSEFQKEFICYLFPPPLRYSVSKPMTVCLQQRQGRYFG